MFTRLQIIGFSLLLNGVTANTSHSACIFDWDDTLARGNMPPEDAKLIEKYFDQWRCEKFIITAGSKDRLVSGNKQINPISQKHLPFANIFSVREQFPDLYIGYDTAWREGRPYSELNKLLEDIAQAKVLILEKILSKKSISKENAYFVDDNKLNIVIMKEAFGEHGSNVIHVSPEEVKGSFVDKNAKEFTWGHMKRLHAKNTFKSEL